MRATSALLILVMSASGLRAADNWGQLQGNALRSGNAPASSVMTPVGLIAAIPLTDGIFASPVVSDGRVFVIDGSGVVFALDATTLKVLWKFASRGGADQSGNAAQSLEVDVGAGLGIGVAHTVHGAQMRRRTLWAVRS